MIVYLPTLISLIPVLLEIWSLIALKSFVSVIKLLTPALLWPMVGGSLFLILLSFYVFCFKCVWWRSHILGSCFLILIWDSRFLIDKLKSFVFLLSSDMHIFQPSYFIFSIYCFFPFFFLFPDFHLYRIIFLLLV